MLAAAMAACVAVAVCFLTDPRAAAETTDENMLRAQLERETNEEICAFFSEDLNQDGQKEAVAITSQTVDELGYANAKVWYITDEKCDLINNIDDASIYPDTVVHLYTLSNTRMLCFTSGWGGSGSVAQAWVFDADGAKEVENVLEGIMQLSENEFMVLNSAYDGETDGTGHTQNRYFSRWDGEKLVEYGGLEISVEQLREAKNADRILDDVKAYGEVQSIYYRANDMVFINLSDRFSIYVPDGWYTIDDAQVLEDSVRMSATAEEASELDIWVACYEGQTASDVKAYLEAEGYTPWEANDEGFDRMVKQEHPLWWDARLYPYDSDNTWVVFSRYDATVEWGGRLDALANTLEVTGDAAQ